MSFKLTKNQLFIGKIIGGICIGVLVAALGYFIYQKLQLDSKISLLKSDKSKLGQQLAKVGVELKNLKSQDQYKINRQLEADMKKIETTYDLAVKTYEKLLDLKNISKKTDKFDSQFADSLTFLSKRNYSSGEAQLKALSTSIDDESQRIASAFQIPQNVASNNSPPGSGYSSQLVHSDVGDFLVEIIAADMNSTRVIVDSASDSDCKNDCPVLPLADYVSRSGAFAGVNGSYFCPADYPSCSGKKNSFDTLLMNKNKHYINSDNNVYSTVPAAIFLGNSMRFVGRSLEWGRDTGVDGVIANFPLLVSGGNIVFNGDGEPKHGAKGSRSFVGSTGNTAYIGVVFNATVAEAAHVLHTLGIQGALNLDDGGSTALWSGGYKAGPGRNLPNAVLFVRK